MASQNEPRTGRCVTELLSALESCAPDDDATRRNALDEIRGRLSAVLDTNDRGPPESRRRLLAGAASADAPVPFSGAELRRLGEALLRWAGDEEKPSRHALLDEARAGSGAAASCLVAARPRQATRAAARRATPRARAQEKRPRSPSPSPDTPGSWYAALLDLSEFAEELEAFQGEECEIRVTCEAARTRLAESRGGLSEEAVCADPTCNSYFDEVESLRRALGRVRDEVAKDCSMRLPNAESLHALCRAEQLDIAHFGTNDGDGHGDYVQLGHRCIRLKDARLWRWALDQGAISEHDHLRLTKEGVALTVNRIPLAMDVCDAETGTRPKPNATYTRLCGSVAARNRLDAAHRAYVESFVRCWARVQSLMGRNAVLVGWGGPGGKLAEVLGEIEGVTLVGILPHMETICRMNSNVAVAVAEGQFVPIVKRQGVLDSQEVLEAVLALRGVELLRPLTVLEERDAASFCLAISPRPFVGYTIRIP